MISLKSDGRQGREEVLGLSPGTHQQSSTATVEELGGCRGARVRTKLLAVNKTIYPPTSRNCPPMKEATTGPITLSSQGQRGSNYWPV